MFFSYPTAPHLAAFILRSESVRGPHLTHGRSRYPTAYDCPIRRGMAQSPRKRTIAAREASFGWALGCTRLAVILPCACARAASDVQNGRRRLVSSSHPFLPDKVSPRTAHPSLPTAFRPRQRHNNVAGVRLTERRPSLHESAPLFQRIAAPIGPLCGVAHDMR
jgi:hypothetical protein